MNNYSATVSNPEYTREQYMKSNMPILNWNLGGRAWLYETYCVPDIHMSLQEILQKSTIDGVLIDEGCGDFQKGAKTLPLLGENGSYFGVDNCPILLDDAKKRAEKYPGYNISFVERNIRDEIATYMQGDLDIVIENQVSHHMSKKDNFKRRAEKISLLPIGTPFVVLDGYAPSDVKYLERYIQFVRFYEMIKGGRLDYHRDITNKEVIDFFVHEMGCKFDDRNSKQYFHFLKRHIGVPITNQNIFYTK